MAKARKHPQGPFVAAEERSLLGFHHRRGGSVASAYGDDDDLPDLAEADVWYTQSFGGECGSSRRRRTRAGNRRGGGGGKHKSSSQGSVWRPARSSSPAPNSVADVERPPTAVIRRRVGSRSGQVPRQRSMHAWLGVSYSNTFKSASEIDFT
uniref:Uncharacterized protein n=1 Tax=Oryza sativa subsp. japonica TaxID=39947 RepID=Q6Z3S8_ORYSJ|nr:hypothetical protein [Oryza sativa Japonica Group]BAD10165.1 hypothetical protein [Oryza sativa Japonica Group]